MSKTKDPRVALGQRGEALAEEGRYYDAIRQYSQALDIERNNALAAFRMGEAFFYQKNYRMNIPHSGHML